MLGELFGTIAAPLIFVGLAVLGVLVTVLVVTLVNHPARRSGEVVAQPERREDGAASPVGHSDDAGLPKII